MVSTICSVLIPKYNSMLKRPVSNGIKVPTCMQRAKIRPVTIIAIVILECENTSVALAHYVVSQNLDAVIYKSY